MKRWIWLLAFIYLAPAWADFNYRTPVFLVNQKYSWVEVYEKQRVYLEYDVRAVGGAGLKVYAFHHRDKLDGPPRREWHLEKPNGRERIHFDDLDLAVYRLWGQAVDAAGQPVAAPSRVVHVQYGGWVAWDDYRTAKQEAKPGDLAEIPVTSAVAPGNARVVVVPQAVVLNPGEVAHFEVMLEGLPEKDAVNWKLDGVGDQGELKVLPDNKAEYHAPKEFRGTKMLRLEVKSVRHPDVVGGASLLITSMSKEELQ